MSALKVDRYTRAAHSFLFLTGSIIQTSSSVESVPFKLIVYRKTLFFPGRADSLLITEYTCYIHAAVR